MSRLFGEVVYPSSRAFWTDDDDDIQNLESLQSFSIEWSGDVPERIKTLIVVETHLIIDFTKDYVLNNAEEVCQIKPAVSSNSSKLYKATDNLFIFIISTNIELSQAGVFVETVSEILKKSDNIIAFTSNHISQLKSADKSANVSYLRSLSTRKASDEQRNAVPVLKQPNIVCGVAAGIVAYAEVMNQSASLNILYLDGYELDSESAGPLTKIFSKVTEHELPKFTCGKLTFNKGNLYM